MSELKDAIKLVESQYLRTDNDIGANINALIILDKFREIANMPPVDMDELTRTEDAAKKIEKALLEG